MGELVIRGVPTSLKQDGWWMASASDGAVTGNPVDGRVLDKSILDAKRFLMVVGLVLLADFLFWKHSVGLSLFLFSAALGVAAVVSLRPVMSLAEWAVATALWFASALPVLEYVQLISVLFLGLGHFGILVWMVIRSPLIGVMRGIARLSYLIPDFVLKTCLAIGGSVSNRRHMVIRKDTMSGWVLPIGLGSVFLVLFLAANPVLENWADSLFEIELSLDSFRRLTFWAVVAALVLPFVLFRQMAKQLSAQALPFEGQFDFDGRLINAQSITNSLLMFNIMFLLQNAADVTFLWGGIALPEGMTYATYAHKGAYPLMGTSVLAGVFAVMSRRYLESSAWLRVLLIVWVVQNLFLVGSSLARLDLYIDVYGLTYLRLRALIGMWLVMTGMMLLLWQLWRYRSNLWVTKMFAGIVLSTLYICCFVNFAYVIAKTNIAQNDGQLDVSYLCTDTRDGIQAVVTYGKDGGSKHCLPYRHSWSPQVEGWRDWSRRQARLDGSLIAYDQLETRAAPSQIDDMRRPNLYQYD